jgi:lipoprotein-anchoring transpeptidase ErfK/SrfK
MKDWLLAHLLRALLIVSALFPGAIAPTLVHAGALVPFSSPVEPGTIVIRTTQRSLYFVLSQGNAIRYPIAVPKSGHEWVGRAAVNGKYVKPDWSPPPCVKADHPELPNFIPGGAPNNPMGARAITLDREQVAIHGTTQKMRRSIGTAASYGCIRMRNEDVIDLFDRVQIGTPVILTP